MFCAHRLAFASPSRSDTPFLSLLVSQHLLQHDDFSPGLVWFLDPAATHGRHLPSCDLSMRAAGLRCVRREKRRFTWSVGFCSSLNDQAVVSELSFSPQLTWHNTLPPFLIQLAICADAALIVFLPVTSFPLSRLIFRSPWTVKQLHQSLQRHRLLA